MIAAAAKMQEATIAELEWFCDQAKLRPVRTLRAFCEEELRIPDGPHSGKRFRVYRQPEVGVWFDLVDKGIQERLWNRFAATGPQQSGKTFSKWLCPMLWALFEWRENVIVFGPTEDILADKWRLDIRPAIIASSYADMMPTQGDGSRDGGQPNLIRFRNGACLKFMSGGGSDKKRSGFTSRWVFGTEIDGMDESGSASREASKVDQIEGRTRAYDEAKLVFLECTVSVPHGRIWQEVKNGTDTRLALPCPHCGVYVTLEREDFKGWQEADTELSAEDCGRFVCSACAVEWNDEERARANSEAVAVHRDQTVDEAGKLCGDMPATRTLGFRYGAVNNLFVSSASLANQEWRAPRSADPDNANKALEQWVWVRPWEEDQDDVQSLDARLLMGRLAAFERGQIGSADEVFVGVDVRKRQLHWVALALREIDGVWGGHVVDYDIESVDSDVMPFDCAVAEAVRRLHEDFLNGWLLPDGSRQAVSSVLIDAGWEQDAVMAAVSTLPVWLPSKGFGHGQFAGSKYRQPQRPSKHTPVVQDGWNISIIRGSKLVEINADVWKSRAYAQLLGDASRPAAVSLYASSDSGAHRTLARHLTAERETFEFSAKTGGAKKWVTLSKHNHFGDAYYIARVALEVWLQRRAKAEAAAARTVGVRPEGGADDAPQRRIHIRKMNRR